MLMTDPKLSALVFLVVTHLTNENFSSLFFKVFLTFQLIYLPLV